MIWPVNGPITSPFCESRAWESCHPGIDIGVPAGTPIRAAKAGKVVLMQSDGVSGGYGNFTCIQHDGALSTCYAHQSRFGTSLGAQVGAGPGDRLRRLHRPLLRRSPALRDPHQRVRREPDELPVGALASECRAAPSFHIFGLTIQTFGLCLGLSFLAAGWLVAKRLKELDRNVDFAYEMVFAALIGGIVGAKLWYLAENGGPLFSGTGLTFYGGLFGGALAVLAWAKYRGELDAQLPDIVAPSLALAYADRADRLPARRRRRLRQELGRPVGDGLSERHRPDRRRPCTRRRSTSRS